MPKRRYSKLAQKQRDELEKLVKTGRDGKEVRMAQAVLLYDEGSSLKCIESITKLKERSVFQTRKKYFEKGLEGIKNKIKRKPKFLLNADQRKEILEFLANKKPTDFGFKSSSWTTTILGRLIEEKYDVIYKSKRPLYLLFREAKLSFHKPGQVYEREDLAPCRRIPCH